MERDVDFSNVDSRPMFQHVLWNRFSQIVSRSRFLVYVQSIISTFAIGRSPIGQRLFKEKNRCVAQGDYNYGFISVPKVNGLHNFDMYKKIR